MRSCLLPPASVPACHPRLCPLAFPAANPTLPSSLWLSPWANTRSTFSWQDNTYLDLPGTIWKPRCQPPRSPQTSCPMARAAVTTMCQLRDAVSHGNLIIAQKGGRERGGAGLEGMDRKPLPWAWGMHAGSQEHTAYAKWNPGPNRLPWHTENLAQSPSLSCLLETCHPVGTPANIAPRSLPGLEFFLGWKLSHGPKDLTGPPSQYYIQIPANSPGRCRGEATAADRCRLLSWTWSHGRPRHRTVEKVNVEKQVCRGGP